MRFVFLIFMLCIVTPCSSADKPVLTVVSGQWEGFSHEDGTGTYWDIIKAIYQDEYQLNLRATTWDRAINLMAQGQADILVGIYKEDKGDWILPLTHIDFEYPIYALFDEKQHSIKSADDLNNLVVAGRSNYGFENFIPESVIFYGVKSIVDINKLVLNKRVNAALVYSYNMHLADPKAELARVEVISEKAIYTAFNNSKKGRLLSDTFDSKMSELLANNAIEALFPNKLEYLHAKFTKADNNTVYWNIIPKRYDSINKRLTPLKREVIFSNYIEKHLPDYHFNIHQNSTSITRDKLRNNENICVLNLMMNDKNNKNMVLSIPSDVYIKPRLITLKSTVQDYQLVNHNDRSINIATLLKNKPKWRVAVTKSGEIVKKLKEKLPKEYLDRLVIIDSFNEEKTLKLLFSKRVDALIVWPSIIPEIADSNDEIAALSSFAIDDFYKDNFFSYIACNDNHQNKLFLEQLNLLLNNPRHQQALYSETTERMDKDSALLFKRLLSLSY